MLKNMAHELASRRKIYIPLLERVIEIFTERVKNLPFAFDANFFTQVILKLLRCSCSVHALAR